MANEFGRAEADATCPVSLDLLGQLYKADEHGRSEILVALSEAQRARLALFCYNRAHFRELAVAIAATCDPEMLVALAGTVGEVLSVQCRAAQTKKAVVPTVRLPELKKTKVSKTKVSLARVSA